MSEASPPPPRPALLYVATVAVTIRQFLSPYASWFVARGWRVDAAARGATGDEVIQGAFSAAHDLPLSRSLRDVRGIVRTVRRLPWLLGAGYDIVHVHTPIASFLVRLAARAVPLDRRPAIVYTAHGFHFHRQGRRATNFVFLLMERLAARWTDRLVVINDEDHEAARRHSLVPSARLVRMPGVGLDTAAYSPSALSPDEAARARSDLAIPPDVPLFVSLGELSTNKRQADLIAALARMANQGAHLVLAGDGKSRERLERLAARLGVAARVRMPGMVREVRPLLAGATALVQASKREGLSRSVMEALSLEVPVIASSARGNQELVGDSGIVVPIGDVAAFAAAMDRLARSPDERTAMGRRGRQRMIERYDLEVLLSLHEALYADLLAARRVPARARAPEIDRRS